MVVSQEVQFSWVMDDMEVRMAQMWGLEEQRNSTFDGVHILPILH